MTAGELVRGVVRPLNSWRAKQMVELELKSDQIVTREVRVTLHVPRFPDFTPSHERGC